MKYILADTNFWIALFGSSDDSDEIRRISAAKDIFSDIKQANFKVLVPRSILAELLRGKFFKGKKILKTERLENILKSDIIEYVEDTKYDRKALALTLQGTKRCKKISYVDNVVRLIIEEHHQNIRYFITFDIKHFNDICEKYNVEIHEKCILNLFSWDKIPGNDNGRLIRFLERNFDIDWIKTANFEKTEEGRTIRVFTEEHFLLLRLNYEKTKANLEIDDGRTAEFSVKMKKGKLNISIT